MYIIGQICLFKWYGSIWHKKTFKVTKNWRLILSTNIAHYSLVHKSAYKVASNHKLGSMKEVKHFCEINVHAYILIGEYHLHWLQRIRLFCLAIRKRIISFEFFSAILKWYFLAWEMTVFLRAENMSWYYLQKLA